MIKLPIMMGFFYSINFILIQKFFRSYSFSFAKPHKL